MRNACTSWRTTASNVHAEDGVITWLWKRAWPVLRETVTAWQTDDGSTLAAAVAYYAAFSFFPLLLVLISGLGFVLRGSEMAQEEQRALIDLIAQSTSQGLATQINDILSTVKNQAAVGGPIGLAALLLGAIGIFAQIDTAFDRIWKVPEPNDQGILRIIHRVLVDRLKAFMMLLALGVLVLVSFIVGMVLTAMATFGADLAIAQWGWRFVRILSIVAFNSLLFTAIFTVVPRARIRWRDAFPGGVLTAIVWEIGRQVLALLIIGAKYSAYGVVGTFVAMMVWVYYASSVLFLGAEFVKVTCERCRPGKIKVGEHAPALQTADAGYLPPTH
jgi:membrane protein